MTYRRLSASITRSSVAYYGRSRVRVRLCSSVPFVRPNCLRFWLWFVNVSREQLAAVGALGVDALGLCEAMIVLPSVIHRPISMACGLLRFDPEFCSLTQYKFYTPSQRSHIDNRT